MKKILLFCLLISSLLHSQDIRSYITTASFSSQEGSFVELYIAFDANTLQLINLGDSFFADIDVEIEISNEEKIVFSNHYLLQSPLFDKAKENNVFFLISKEFL